MQKLYLNSIKLQIHLTNNPGFHLEPRETLELF